MLKQVIAAVLVAAAGTASAADRSDEGTRLMAQMKAAMGGPALDKPTGFHETGTVMSDGVAMTYETWGDLKSLRSASTQSSGGHQVSSGFDGKVSWSTDQAGTAHVDTTPDALASARLGTYLTIGGYFYPDRFPARFEYLGHKLGDDKTYDVVTAMPEGSVAVDLWLDPASHRLQRVSGMDGKTPFAGVVDDYREVDGALIGFSLKLSQGAHHSDGKLSTFVFQDVPAEHFSPPQH